MGEQKPEKRKNIYVLVCWPMSIPERQLYRKGFCICAARSEKSGEWITEMLFWIRMNWKKKEESRFFQAGTAENRRYGSVTS